MRLQPARPPRLRGAAAALALALALPLLPAGAAHARTGGPDLYGYTWRDSDEPSVTYSWVDISTTGQVLTDLIPALADDDANSGFLRLSFRVPYYGQDIDFLAVCTNGWVSLFDSTDVSYVNVSLPTNYRPIATIAAMWDDLFVDRDSRILFQDFGDRAVVTWENMGYVADDTQVTTFQVILHADGLIVSQIQSAPIANRCTVGIEMEQERSGLNAWFNSTAMPGSNYRVEFLPPTPRPRDLDCTAATPFSCRGVFGGDLALGTANQDGYICSAGDFSGKEQVWRIDLAEVVDLGIELRAISGNPQVVVLDSCDPNYCLEPPSTVGTTVRNARGTIYVVVDCRPGEEGQYELTIACRTNAFTFCGDGLYDSSPPTPQTFGTPSIPDILYSYQDTHNFALRVDGTTVYTQDDNSGCTQFPFFNTTVAEGGPGSVEWSAPEGRVVVTASREADGRCCGLLFRVDVTNTDTRAHRYDWRAYHDTAFAWGSGTCGFGFIDGGPIQVGGTTYTTEQELVPLGADQCEGQILLYSADSPGVLRGSFQMRGPNPPVDMEYLHWDDGGGPCPDWANLVDGQSIGNCNEDSSLLFIWQFPPGGGTLAPGETSSAFYRLGWWCAWPCTPGCEDPVLGGGSVSDLDACGAGLELTWTPAFFPGAGDGVYHVYRSPASFADALTRMPITPAGGITAPAWTDDTTLPGVMNYYVVQAESLDFPGCGDGPVTSGSTDELQLGPAEDVQVERPVFGAGTAVDADRCAVDVQLTWDAAAFPAPGNGVYHVYRSTVSWADALTRPALTPRPGTAATDWLDDTTAPDGTYYYVILAESTDWPDCGDGPFVNGPTATLNLGPVTDVLDVTPPAAGVGPNLAAWDGTPTTVLLSWIDAPGPEPDGGFVVYRADDVPTGPFDEQARPTAQEWTDPDAPPRFAPSHVWFYRVVGVDSCGNETAD